MATDKDGVELVDKAMLEKIKLGKDEKIVAADAYRVCIEVAGARRWYTVEEMKSAKKL